MNNEHRPYKDIDNNTDQCETTSYQNGTASTLVAEEKQSGVTCMAWFTTTFVCVVVCG